MAVRRWVKDVARTGRHESLVILAIFLLAFIPRIVQLDAAPPGLNGDEVYNLIDARRIGVGNWPVFLAGNQGREALYFYFLAASVKLFGLSVWSLRLPSVLLGSGAAVLAYLIGRDMFGRKAGIVGAALIAVSFWPLMLSRMALRAMSLTFFTALTVWLLYRALHGGGRREWILCGVALGLTLYTYIPARVFPLVIVGWLLWIWWQRREQLARHYRKLLLALLLAALIFAPFGAYMVRNPEAVNQRIQSMTNALDRARAGEPEALLASVGGVLRMFSFEGDEEWRYHLAHQPVFDPITSLFFYAGAGLSLLYAFRRRGNEQKGPEFALMWLWMGAMLAPNAVLNENPSFIRAAGAIVPVYLMVGIGVQAVVDAVQRRRALSRWGWALLLVGGLALTLGYTLRNYFVVWNNDPQVRTVYHASQAAMGRFLEGPAAPDDAPVFVGYTYVYDSPTSLALSLFTDRQVTWFDQEGAFAWLEDEEGLEAVSDSWYLLPMDAQLPADIGARLEQAGDSEIIHFRNGDAAFTAHHVTEGIVIVPQHQIDLHFSNGLRLRGYDVRSSMVGGETVDVLLHWQVDGSVAERVNRLTFVLVHLADAGGVVRARGEALLGLPQAGWGDDVHFVQKVRVDTPLGMLPGPATLSFGLRDEAGEPMGSIQTPEGAEPLLVRGATLDDFGVTEAMTVYDDVLALTGASFQPLVVPGAALNVSLNWVALDGPQQDYRVQLSLQNEEGETLLAQTFAMWPDVYPPTRWQRHEVVTTLHGLRVPVDFAAAVQIYLHIALLPPGEGTTTVRQSGAPGSLGVLELDVRERVFEATAVEHRVDVQFGDAIRLLGYELDADNAAPGGSVRLKLVWQAIQTPDNNYTVFNHVVGDGGDMRGQLDAPPVGEAWLTETWLPGEVVVEEREIPIFDEAPTGEVGLFVGLYGADDLQPLPVLVNGEPLSENRVLLQTFRVRGGE